MLGEGEKTLTELVKLMIKNDKKLPSQEALKELPGIAFLEKPNFQSINIGKKGLVEKNLNL